MITMNRIPLHKNKTNERKRKMVYANARVYATNLATQFGLFDGKKTCLFTQILHVIFE